MHKSAYKLRFFLMALILPTVGAEIPIGNMNLFENAMAITPEYNYIITAATTTIVMKICIANILQKIRKLLVKLVNLKVSLLNQSNSVN